LIGSVVFTIPRYFDEYAVTLPDGSRSEIILTSLGNNYVYQIFYKAVAFYIVVYVIPIVALIFMTYRLIVSLKKFYARREQVTSAGRAENDLTKTLVVVVIVFMICQVLNPIRRVLLAVLPANQLQCGSSYSIFYPLTAVGIVLDSSIHFFLYSLCDRRFRGRLRERMRYSVQLLERVVSGVTVTAVEQVSTLGAQPSVNSVSRISTNNRTGRRGNDPVELNATDLTNLAPPEGPKIGLGTNRVTPSEVVNGMPRRGHESTLAVVSIA